MLAGKVRRSEIQFIAYKSADRLPRIDSGADALAVDREFDAAHADNASMMLRDTVAACVLASNGSGSTPASRSSSSKAARMTARKVGRASCRERVVTAGVVIGGQRIIQKQKKAR